MAVIGAGQPPARRRGRPRMRPASELLEFAAKRARDGGFRALLVMRGDELLLSRYFGVDDERTLLPAGLIARPMAAMAIGLALADGRIDTLDTPVSRYLKEWEDEPRGRITLRQLLEDTSGLEDGGDVDHLLHRSPWGHLRGLAGVRHRQGRANVVRQRFCEQRVAFPAASTSPAASTARRRPTCSSPR